MNSDAPYKRVGLIGRGLDSVVAMGEALAVFFSSPEAFG